MSAYDILKLWQSDPPLADDGCDAPTREIIDKAIRLSEQLRIYAEPVSVVTDANGGIVFRFFEDGNDETVRIDADGSLDFYRFNEQIVFRITWPGR